MLYADLETKAYALTRRGLLADALILVLTQLHYCDGPDAYDAQVLLAELEVRAGTRNLLECMSALERIVVGDGVRPKTRLKGHLLATNIAMQRIDLAAWKRHLAALGDLVHVLPEWVGRVTLMQANYHETSGELDQALELHLWNIHWYNDNVGPYDDQDRQCQLALCHNGLSRLYLKLGDTPRALWSLKLAERYMPNGPMRVHVELGRVRYCMATRDIQTALLLLEDAKTGNSTQVAGYALRMIEELRAECLLELGRLSQAQEVINDLVQEAGRTRDLELLGRMQVLGARLVGERKGVS